MRVLALQKFKPLLRLTPISVCCFGAIIKVLVLGEGYADGLRWLAVRLPGQNRLVAWPRPEAARPDCCVYELATAAVVTEIWEEGEGCDWDHSLPH